MTSRIAITTTLLLALFAFACLTAAQEQNPPEIPAASVADPFPNPGELRDQVDFWRNVFSAWSLGQVVIHDMDHPELVYEVLTLPGNGDEGYSRGQRHFVRAARTALEARLRALEKKVIEKAPLADDEKALALRITTTAGTDALRDASRRVRSQRGLRERFRRGLEISGRYDAAFRQVFREAGLPEDLAYLPHVESSFQASARSSAGAVGVWQFTRGAARRFLTLTSAIDERQDPVAAAAGAARYLRTAYGLLGDWALAITSYNHGIEGMARAKERYGTDFGRIVREFDGRYFGFASKNFYAEFLAAREIASDSVRFFPEGLNREPPLAMDRVTLDRPTAPYWIAQRFGVELALLASINPAWTRRAVRGGLAVPAGTAVWLPGGTLARIPSAGDPPPVPTPPSPSGAAGADRATASTFTDAMVHVVRRGESLFKIAAVYGVTVADLLGLNALTERSILRPGQRIRIPLR